MNKMHEPKPKKNHPRQSAGSRFSDLLLLRSCYPHALQGQDGDSICLHVRCPSR